MKTYRVGILGFGMIGKVHAYGYRNLPLFYVPCRWTARITHVVTSRAETAERRGRRSAPTWPRPTFRAVTENPDIDIVHICTPNHLHKDALLSAMRAAEAHLLRQAAGGDRRRGGRNRARPCPITAASPR